MSSFHWCGRGEQEQSLGCHPMTYCGPVPVALRKHLKSSLLTFLHEGKLILWFSSQEYTGKKTLLSPVLHDIVLGLWPRHLRWCHCWAPPHGLAHYLIQFSVVHGHQPQAIWLFYWPYQAIERLWTGNTTSTWIVSLIYLCLPGNLCCLTVTNFHVDW